MTSLPGRRRSSLRGSTSLASASASSASTTKTHWYRHGTELTFLIVRWSRLVVSLSTEPKEMEGVDSVKQGLGEITQTVKYISQPSFL